MAAFASNYGEFWLLAQIYSSNQLAKSVAILKQLPIILEHSGLLRPRFEALNHLIRIMLEVTGCIVEFRELPSTYISPDMPALSTATSLTPTAVYWTIRSIVACATQISSLTTMGHEYAPSLYQPNMHRLNLLIDNLDSGSFSISDFTLLAGALLIINKS